jgi:hypothetical protein
MTSPSRRRRGFSLVEALDREWCDLGLRHPGTVSRSADRHDVLAPCGSFDDVLQAARLNSDPILAALLTEVASGDQLAGRVVLQSLIGRMVRMAEREPHDGIDDYIARLWCVINSYPLSRRPVWIAANLSMDTVKAVSREHRWMGRGDVTLWSAQVASARVAMGRSSRSSMDKWSALRLSAATPPSVITRARQAESSR